MKFKAKAKDCQLLVKAKTSIGESIDEKELDRFSRVYLRGFLKPKMVKRNLIEYTGPVGISLYERLKKPTNKREFLFILEQIVVAVQKLQANGMGLNNLVIDLQHVYILNWKNCLFLSQSSRKDSTPFLQIFLIVLATMKIIYVCALAAAMSFQREK